MLSNNPTTGWVLHYVEYGDKVNCQTINGALVNCQSLTLDNHNPTLNNPWISMLPSTTGSPNNNKVAATLYNID